MCSFCKSASLSALILSSAAFFVSCDSDDKFRTQDGLIWNTSFHVVYAGPESLSDSILSVLDAVGRSLSVFDDSSLVSKVNNSDSLPVDEHFKKVWSISKRVGEESGGSFDPTLSPLITAWGFGPGHKASADTARLDSILHFVGMNRTSLRGDMLIKDDPRVQFNFSAVAKGYACDAVGEMFLRNNVSDWLVEIGGEVAVHGFGPFGKWRISVDKPIFSSDAPVHESQCVISPYNQAVATSGNYRNLMKGKGGTYGHTISPQTGRPVQTDVISATVIASSCAEADAYATACMAMGGEAARGMITHLNLPAMLVLSDSSLWTSQWFDEIVEGYRLVNGRPR